MEKDWIKIRSFADLQEATIVADHLRQEGVETVIMDKSVSGFVSAADVELYCHENNAKKALELIENGSE